MSINALLTQYNTKLLFVLNELEKISGDLVKTSIDKINEQATKLIKSIRYQAYTSAATGFVSGGVAIGQHFVPANAPAKLWMELSQPLLPKVGEFATTMLRAEETKHQLHERLLQDHVLISQRELKAKFEEARHTQEQKIANCMDLKAQGDRLH